jgi:hypothetical protein
MDFSKFKTPDWLVIGGGLAVLIGGFLKWFTVDGFSGGPNAFDYTLTGLIPWVLVVGAAVITFLLATGVIAKGGTPWPLIILGATALGALLIIIRVLIGEDDPFDRGAGLWISALGGIVAAAGAFLGFQASGGNVRDLTDMEKMKSAFK